MNETASESPGEPAPAALLVLAPLPPHALTPALQKLLVSPAPAKLMALKGIAALRPAELLLAVYELSFDGDAAVKAAADAAPAVLPDKVLVPSLAEALPPVVLHFFAIKLAASRIPPLERILYNHGTADATFVVLAGRLGERELEVICQNDTRLLRCPAIVEALFSNKNARMSSVNRAIELCARNKVKVDGIPSFDEIVRAINEDPNATDPAVADAAFQQVLETSAALDPAEGDTDEEAGADGKKKKTLGKSPIIDFTKLKLYEKIRLATLGNAYCRSNLIRDSNRMVSMAVIRSPLITDGEVARAAGNRQVSEDVIRYIANQRDFTKMYAVRIGLVQNPKCPVVFSMRFLPLLHADDLKKLSKSKNVPSVLAMGARKLIQTRSKKSE